MNEEYFFKKQLAGSVEILDCYKVNPEKILSPFENSDTVIRGYCAVCDSYYEFNNSEAKEIATLINVVLPEELHGKFFKFQSCDSCRNHQSLIELDDVVNA